MAERFKFNDEEENIDENDNQQDDLEKEYYDNTDYSYTKSENNIRIILILKKKNLKKKKHKKKKIKKQTTQKRK